jgi:hypothetical protein
MGLDDRSLKVHEPRGLLIYFADLNEILEKVYKPRWLFFSLQTRWDLGKNSQTYSEIHKKNLQE